MEHLAFKAGEGMNMPVDWQAVAVPLDVRDFDVSTRDVVGLCMDPYLHGIYCFSSHSPVPSHQDLPPQPSETREQDRSLALMPGPAGRFIEYPFGTGWC